MATFNASLANFKQSLGKLARPNRFLVGLATPDSSLTWENNFSYLVKSATLPGRELEEQTINWMGMKTKPAGITTFNDVELTFYNDGNGSCYEFWYGWLHLLVNDSSNTRADANAYRSTIRVHQLTGGQGSVDFNPNAGNNDSNDGVTYALRNAFPKTVAPINLDEASSEFQEFSVTIAYEYLELNPTE